MDMKVNTAMVPTPVETPTQVTQSDGTFKFTLASHIQEADLQARLNTLMEEITMQGDRIAKRKDIRDMKKYRGLIKDFMKSFKSFIPLPLRGCYDTIRRRHGPGDRCNPCARRRRSC